MTDVQRTVGTHSVTLARTYSTSVEDLWQACTNPERISRWFLPVSGDLRVGGSFALEGNAHGTIESCDPPRAFTATWEFGDTVSRIALRLTAVGDDETRFELEHSGLENEQWEEYGPGAVGLGWDGAIMGLGLHLATGAAGDPSWIASEEAKRFFAESSERWRDANIAAGTDPATAQKRADRTTAAYTA